MLRTYWAFYLSHHWAYRREPGEPQITFNYTRALSDFITNFCFGRGVHFKSAHETEHIVPALLKRVWEVDNSKTQVLWEMGQQGGVSGDCFVKIAWENPYEDSVGQMHPGRCRILPLNSAFAYPEWHPHDRDRLIRFKLKYKFWGCVDSQTEVLTKDGWKRYDQISDGVEILARDPKTDQISWQPAQINIYPYDGEMVRWSGGIDALTTPNHRWLVEAQRGRGSTVRYERGIGRTRIGLDGDKAVSDLRKGSRVLAGGGEPGGFSYDETLADELVKTVAWYVTEGCDHYNRTGFHSILIGQKSQPYLDQIRDLGTWWRDQGMTFNERKPDKNGVVTFYLGKGSNRVLEEYAPSKSITPEFLSLLSPRQARMFFETLIDGDGSRTNGSRNTIRWKQVDAGRLDGFQMLCSMLGLRTHQFEDYIQVYDRQYVGKEVADKAVRTVTEDGVVWCPSVEGGIWMARRNGSAYWTGNTAPEGTRQVYTYTEILTEEVIEEYVNDELIDQRPNPLGVIPIVHIPNIQISGSPWGLSDLNDIINLNREYNEKALEISDIINYHAAPVTIITGAKASNLEKGPKKVWSLPPKEANAFNLLGGTEAIPQALAYLETIKRAMHEMTGVPETALGQMQPISNTSGVALHIQYQPMMQRYSMKKMTYEVGLKKINEYVLRTLVHFDPETVMFDPATEGLIEDPEAQPPVLNPLDPLVYQTVIHWPPPLPVDALIKLNEIQAKFALGLESKRGALEELGEEFPDEKMQEIFAELVDDAKEQAALDFMKAQIQAAILEATGIIIGEGVPEDEDPQQPGSKPSTSGKPQSSSPQASPGLTSLEKFGAEEMNKMINDIVTRAYGTKIPQRRNPDNNND